MSIAICLLAVSTLMSAPESPTKKWVLTLAEEFDGPAGAPANPKVWKNDVGGHGYGNNEWQFYTEGNKNATLDGKGNLVIEARKEKTGNRDYSSARLLSKGLFSQQYGKFEARVKLPQGKGIWPAFWMMGDDIDKVGWPRCGEIDVMEFLGHDGQSAYGTIHGPGYSGAQSISTKRQLPEGSSFLKDFHTFGVEWSKEKIEWFVDGVKYREWTAKDTGSNKWAFDKPFFILLNLAVGGNWPGYPDENTKFPQKYIIDYVRAYKEA